MTAIDDQKEQSCSKIIVVLLSIVLTSSSGVWLGYQYYWADQCGIPLLVVISTTVFVAFFYIQALLRLCNVTVFRDNATILTVSLACIYIVYMSWAAIATNDTYCPLNFSTNTNTVMQIVLGVFFTFLTVLSIAIASDIEVSNKA